jgi:hypothetical protein
MRRLTNLVGNAEQTGAKHCAGCEDLPIQERDFGDVSLDQEEDAQGCETENKHGNNVAFAPAICCGSSNSEWEQSQNETSGKQERAKN